MAGVLVLSADKSLVVVHHRAGSEEVQESFLRGIDTTGLAQLGFRVQGSYLYAQFFYLLVADAGNLAPGD